MSLEQNLVKFME